MTADHLGLRDMEALADEIINIASTLKESPKKHKRLITHLVEMATQSAHNVLRLTQRVRALEEKLNRLPLTHSDEPAREQAP